MLAGFLAAMRDHSGMSAIEPVNAAIAGGAERRCNIIRENALLTLMLCSVVRAAQALAGDQPSNTDIAREYDFQNQGAVQAASNADSALKHDFQNHIPVLPGTAPMFSIPFVSVKPPVNDAFSATEFRPRRRNVMGLDPSRSDASIIDAPMLKSTSVWQHMSDFKSQDRVRLLTLWQTRGSSLSLQAGKRGAPSLQWSTPWVHREGTTSRGLFDRLLAVPVRAAGNNLRSSVARQTGAAAQPKPRVASPGVSIK
jgi:hypothetical protein